MGDTATVQGRVMKFFSEKLQIDGQDPEADLIEAGVLDSLMFVDLILHLEQAFGCVISIESFDVECFRSIKRITEFIATASVVQSPQDSLGAAEHQSIL